MGKVLHESTGLAAKVGSAKLPRTAETGLLQKWAPYLLVVTLVGSGRLSTQAASQCVVFAGVLLSFSLSRVGHLPKESALALGAVAARE